MDPDTFLTTVYGRVDDVLQTQTWPRPVQPGPAARLTLRAAVTLALLGQWRQFGTERAFSR